MNILEFHDIEQLTQDLFSSNPDIAENVRDRYDEILMDEYQDTSLLQEEIFSKIKKADNVFMVGDMKQSIYRFRSSDPTIFKDKIDSFSKKDDQLRRMIILSNNFRSRKEILDSINDVFSAIMSENAGELDYDDSQRLNIIEKLAAEKDPKYKSECVTISVESGDDGEDSPDKVRAEARYIASEIIRLKNDGFEISDNGNKRPIQNRDFAILLSKYKNVAEIYASELNDAGIECHAESSGYFDQSEIRLMLSLLSVISNPYSDIPLIGVLRSPIASFTDDDIVTIRKCKKGKFYSALKEMSARTEKDDFHLAKKCAHFLENLARWRRYSRYMSCDKLLWTLYEETDFYAFCGAMYDGEVMQANLRLLFLRARQYEDTGFRGLFNFIKHIENLKKRDADIAAAKLIQDDRDAVRIMTIHKSKGLEMPVVFIAGGGSSFNKSQNDSRILLHKKYGLGFDHISYEHRYKTETLEKKLLKNALSKEQISEEIRKLYVAMTRAREKLYFISSFKFDELNPDACELGKKKTRWESSTEDNTVKLTPFDVLSSKCFADWVVPVARCSDDWLCLEYSSKAVSVPETATALEIPKSESDINIDAVLDFDYPHKEATMLATKVTVSQLKQSDETIMAPMPVFMSNTTNTGAFYGTAMHNFIKHIDLSGDFSIEYIESELERLGTGGVLSENEAKKINTKKIHTFFTSELGKRIQNSKRVFREQPFEVTLSADTLYPDNPNVSDESVILQGVIDCYFEEDDGLVLVDYKTDRFENSDEIRKKYALQLELYAIALEKITKKSVKNKYFYLFFDDSVIE